MSKYTPRENVPEVIRDFMRTAGQHGSAGRLARMPTEERREVARAGGMARAAKARAAKQPPPGEKSPDRTSIHPPGSVDTRTAVTPIVPQEQSDAEPVSPSHTPHGASLPKRERLSKTFTGLVVPDDAFEYLSGWLSPDDSTAPSFPMVYAFDNLEVGWQLKVIGPGINMDFPLAALDEALQMYKLVVQRQCAKNR